MSRKIIGLALLMIGLAAAAWGQAEAFPKFTISRIAGLPLSSGMKAVEAYIPGPVAVAWDGRGGFYFSTNNYDNRVFHVTQAGVIDLIIGNGKAGFSGDGGSASDPTVELSYAAGLAVDSQGNLYIADFFNGRVRRVAASTGVITTIAGNGTSGAPGDGGPATNASLNQPTSVAFDQVGNLYIAESGRVRKIAQGTGTISTVAGFGGQVVPLGPYSGDGGPATSATFGLYLSLALDGAGNLYMADFEENCIRKVTAATGIITTIAGTAIGQPGTGDGGTAIDAFLDGPSSIAVDLSGNLIVSDYFGIRKITPAGIISTIAGGVNSGFYSGDGGPVSSTSIPQGGGPLAIDSSGNLLYGDIPDLLVLEIDSTTTTIHTVAGSLGGVGDGGPAASASLSIPAGLAVDAAGNVYIADSGAARIRKIAASTGIITSVVGNGRRASSGDGGSASSAGILTYANNAPPSQPIAVDQSGNLFLFDANTVREVSAQTGIIATVAGGGSSTGTAADNGPATSANLNYLTDMVAAGSSLHLMYFDSSGTPGDGFGGNTNSLRFVDLTTGIIRTIPGAPPANSYGFDRDANGDFYISDGFSIYELVPATGIDSAIVNAHPCQYAAPECVFTNPPTGAEIGDGGPAQAATLLGPQGVRVDGSGNLYIVDSGSGRIRFVSKATGAITTIAGTGASGCTGTSGPATNALFSGPTRVGLDSAGNVYVVDSSCAAVYKLTPVRAYSGNLDAATCQAVSGWAADQNRLNQSINVSIYDGATLIATVPANLARSDVGSYLGDNGLHGFSYTLPAALTGGAHAIHVEFETSTTELGGSPKSLTCGVSGVPSYTGNIDSATCSGISGWIADRNRLNTSITVSLWDGATQIASTTANLSRPDVGAAIGDNGVHGFTLQVPSAYKNGASHTLQVHYETTATQVGSPVTLTCGASANYTGSIDSATCSGISGWVADRNQLNTPITVSLWDGATQIASTTANLSRPDVGAAIGDNGVHGFTLQLPSAYKNGASHTLQVHYESTAVEVGSPVTLTCGGSTANYAGNVDSASCTGISGWVADRNRPNTSITVSLWDGATQIASTTANASRADVGAYLGDNGLHGFTLQLPSAYANGGVSHTLQVHYEATSTPVGSSFVLACGSSGTTNYIGFVDSSSCAGINGWAADRNRPNTSITVSLWDGATQIASTTASGSRPDVGAAIGDNGLHGYALQLPASYANGVSHTLQVHFESSTTQLTGSPVTLQCGSATPNYAGNMDILSCSTIAGWAANRNNLNTSISVNIYDGSTLLTTIQAAASRPDVGAAIGDNGLHGFSLATPSSLKNGAPHVITVLPGTSQTPLAGAQSLTCN